MDCSTPGFPVHHLELAQTHVHRVGDSPIKIKTGALGQWGGDLGRRSGFSDAERVSSMWTRSQRVWKEQDPGMGSGDRGTAREAGGKLVQGVPLPARENLSALLQLHTRVCVCHMQVHPILCFRVLATREFLKAGTSVGPPATLPNGGLLNSDWRVPWDPGNPGSSASLLCHPYCMMSTSRSSMAAGAPAILLAFQPVTFDFPMGMTVDGSG